METEKRYKVILMGESNSGKTSIANRISKDIFISDQPSTIGSCQFDINQKFDNQPVRYSLWDTAGQEKYRSLIPSYTRDADIILLVFDLSDPDHFSSIEGWYQVLKQTMTGNPLIILIGNKLDLGISMDLDKIQECCDKISKDMKSNNQNAQDVVFLETSAKTTDGIQNLIDYISKSLLEMNQNVNETTKVLSPPPLQELPKDSRKKKCC